MEYGFTPKVSENLALNRKELNERKTFLGSYPIKIYIEPTQRCNLDCPMCDRNRRRLTKDMDMGLYRRIEAELFPYVAEVNYFMTGEATLAGNFHEMIASSRHYSFLPKIFTNGVAFSEKTIKAFVDLGFFVNVSLDAVSPGIYEKMRPKATFEGVYNNLERMLEYGRRSANKRFHIRLAATLGIRNVQEAGGIVWLAHELGIEDVMFMAMDLGPVSSLHLSVDVDKTLFHLKKAKEMADEFRIRFSCPKKIGYAVIERNHNWDDFKLPIDRYAPFQLEESNPYNGSCGYPWIQSGIRSNGLVVSCCQRQHVMGDMKEESFRSIWNGEEYAKLRSQKSFYECTGRECNAAHHSIWKGRD